MLLANKYWLGGFTIKISYVTFAAVDDLDAKYWKGQKILQSKYVCCIAIEKQKKMQIQQACAVLLVFFQLIWTWLWYLWTLYCIEKIWIGEFGAPILVLQTELAVEHMNAVGPCSLVFFFFPSKDTRIPLLHETWVCFAPVLFSLFENVFVFMRTLQYSSMILQWHSLRSKHLVTAAATHSEIGD